MTTATTNRVFVIEPPRNELDINKASTFGNIAYLFDRDIRRHSVFKSKAFGADLLQRLEAVQYNPDQDYICIAGSMVTVCVSVIVIAQRYDAFTVLLFNSINDAYEARRFDCSDLN